MIKKGLKPALNTDLAKIDPNKKRVMIPNVEVISNL